MRIVEDFEDLGWVQVSANNNEFDILLIKCKKCGCIIPNDETRKLHMNWHLSLGDKSIE
ncbi:hypothetical protein LCGC14_0372390 [marine sediment metagenome]|uniref:Uncharacterized protein n=1 Tax=marine sediment metagenome TaxID=412755 RepID=A0A0F9WDA3_9ZZZZ